MFAVVINKSSQKYAVVPYNLAETKLPSGWEIESWHEKEGILRRGSMYPECIWKNFDEVGPDMFKSQDIEFQEDTIKLEITKSGAPALWECGGGMSSLGFAQIICDSRGEPKKPVLIRTRGDLSNGNHALFIINKGDYVINVVNKDGDCKVYRVVGIQDERIKDTLEGGLLLGWDSLGGSNIATKKEEPKEKYARCEIVAASEHKAWWPELPEHLQKAYKAGVAKANEYHCRRAFYTKPK